MCFSWLEAHPCTPIPCDPNVLTNILGDIVDRALKTIICRIYTIIITQSCIGTMYSFVDEVCENYSNRYSCGLFVIPSYLFPCTNPYNENTEKKIFFLAWYQCRGICKIHNLRVSLICTLFTLGITLSASQTLVYPA